MQKTEHKNLSYSKTIHRLITVNCVSNIAALAIYDFFSDDCIGMMIWQRKQETCRFISDRRPRVCADDVSNSSLSNVQYDQGHLRPKEKKNKGKISLSRNIEVISTVFCVACWRKWVREVSQTPVFYGFCRRACTIWNQKFTLSLTPGERACRSEFQAKETDNVFLEKERAGVCSVN